jgi:hypothetical protein
VARGAAEAPFGVAFVLLAATLGIALVALLYALAPSGIRRRPSKEPRRYVPPVQVGWATRAMVIALPFLVAALLIAVSVLIGHNRGRHPGAAPPPPLARSLPHAGQAKGGEPGWTLAAGGAFVLAVLVGGAALVVLERRHPPRRPERAPPPEEPRPSEAVAQARPEPSDAREVVLAAYTTMREDLSARGLRISPADAPREYLRRASPQLGPALPHGERLTSLYEVARFSEHPIDDTAARAAGEALAALTERSDD